MREYLVLREFWVNAESPQEAAEKALRDDCDPYARCAVVEGAAAHDKMVLAVLGGEGAEIIHVPQ